MRKAQEVPYPLRMPPNIRCHLQKKADEIGRSLHTEIMRRLEESVKKEQQNASK